MKKMGTLGNRFSVDTKKKTQIAAPSGNMKKHKGKKLFGK